MTDTILAIPSSGTAGLTAPQSYTQYSYTYTATAAQTYLTFEFRQDPAFWQLDDVSVTNAGGTQLLTNGGFETGTTSGWTAIGRQGLTSAGAASTTMPHSGSYEFRDGAVGGVDGIYQAFATTAGQQYTVSFWLQNTGNSTGGALALVQVGNNLYPATPANLALATASDTGTQGDGITTVTRPVITGTAAVGDTITLYDGAAVIGTTTVANDGTWSVTPSANLAIGAHTLSATQTAGTNAASAASGTLALTIVAPPAAPTLALAPASDTGVLNDARTAIATPVITGQATAGNTVSLFDGATLLGTTIVAANGTWSITPGAALSEGAHTLTATQTDTNGNVSANGAYALTIDTTAPALPTLALSPASDSGTLGDRLTNVTTPVLTGTAEAGSTVTLHDGSAVVGTAVAAGNGAWSITTSTLAAGLHDLTATATDAAGNVSLATAALALTIDTAPPVLSAALLHAPATAGGPVIDPTIAGTADPNASVTITEANVTLGTATADANGHWQFTPQNLANGAHTLVAAETDAAGNVASVQLSVTLDTAPPADSMSTGLDSIGLMRFFDTQTGTQFLTSSRAEAAQIAATRPDLTMEGMDLNALNPTTVALDPASTPVYRFFDGSTGTHLFTASTGERDNVLATRPDLTFEGIGFYEHTAAQPGDAAVYRFFDAGNGTHFYTQSDTERATIGATRPDMVYEGISFYAPMRT